MKNLESSAANAQNDENPVFYRESLSTLDPFSSVARAPRAPQPHRTLGFCNEHLAMVDKYQAHKRECNLLDFTDLLFRYAGIGLNDELEMYPAYPEGSVPHEVRLWIMDEYQDCSVLLDRVVDRLTEGLTDRSGDVWMAGDDCQAIYGFSGSDHRVLKARESAAKSEGNRLLLNQSFRNPPQVLHWGEEVLR